MPFPAIHHSLRLNFYQKTRLDIKRTKGIHSHVPISHNSYSYVRVFVPRNTNFSKSYFTLSLHNFLPSISLPQIIKMGHSQPLSLYFRLFNTVDSKQINVRYKSVPMTGFEPWTSGIVSDRSTNWATIAALLIFCLKWSRTRIGERWDFGCERKKLDLGMKVFDALKNWSVVRLALMPTISLTTFSLPKFLVLATFIRFDLWRLSVIALNVLTACVYYCKLQCDQIWLFMKGCATSFLTKVAQIFAKCNGTD